MSKPTDFLIRAMQYLQAVAMAAPKPVISAAAVKKLVDSRSVNDEFMGRVLAVAEKEFGVGRRVLSASQPSPYSLVVEAIRETLPKVEVIAAANAKKRDFFVGTGPDNPLAGKAVAFDGDEEAGVREATTEEVRKAKVIVVPGVMGGINPKHLLNTRKQFGKIFDGKVDGSEMIVFCPIDEGSYRARRYFKSLEPYFNPHHIDPIAFQAFFEEIMKPRLLDEGGRLRDPKDCDNVVFAQFSGGVRDMAGYMLGLKRYLDAQGRSRSESREYTDRMVRINVGSPPIGGHESEGSHSLTVHSAEDFGGIRPLDFYKRVLCNEAFLGEEAVRVVVPRMDSTRKVLAVMGPGLMRVGEIVEKEKGKMFLPNSNGHMLSCYVDSILKNPVLSELVEAYSSFVESGMTREEFEKRVSEAKKQAKTEVYPAEREPRDSDIKEFMECVRGFMLRVEVAERKASMVSRVLRSREADAKVETRSISYELLEEADLSAGEDLDEILKSFRGKKPTDRGAGR